MNHSRTVVKFMAMMFAATVFLSGQVHAQTSAEALKDYEDTVRHADALVATGNAFEAVRVYERAGRIAYNNKLAVDTAAFNQKIAAARSARDAKSSAQPTMQSSPFPGNGTATERTAANSAGSPDVDKVNRSELILSPPPPLPHGPGDDAGPRFLSDQLGKLRPWSLHKTFVMKENRITDVEFHALEANLQKISKVIIATPILNPPRGFELYTNASLGEIESVEERKHFLATRMPLHASIVFSAAGYVESRLRSKSTGAITTHVATLEETHCALRLYVNNPPIIGVEYSDAQGPFFLEPVKNGELGGLPVFDDVLLVTRPSDKPWIPVSTERALKFLLPKYKQDADLASSYVREKQKSYENYMSPAAQDKRRREVAAMRASGAEENARILERKQRRWEEDARNEADAAVNNPKWRAPINNYQSAQSMLASLNPQERAAPACVMTGRPHSSISDWRVVAIGTPGCRPVVQNNPNLLNSKLPRSALQIMYARDITYCNKYLESEKHLRDNPGDCVAMAKLLRQIDWQELAGLLVR